VTGGTQQYKLARRQLGQPQDTCSGTWFDPPTLMFPARSKQ